MMRISSIFRGLAAIGAGALLALMPPGAGAQTPAKTAVLVHGAFADGSSWQKVIPLLLKAGLKVVAVQNPLESLESDVAATNRALDLAEGPVVLVGHSWGGVVITEAGVHEKVKSVVYAAAYTPDVGQSLVDTLKGYPEPAGRKGYAPDSKGYLKLSDDGVFTYFAPDLSRAEQEIVAATQGTYNRIAPTQPVTKAAWRKNPAFVLVSGNDLIIPPEMQRERAKLIKATVAEVPSSHVVMLSHPDAVARMILEAAR